MTNKEIGTMPNGKRFRPNTKRIAAEREGQHSEIKEREIVAIFQIEGIFCTEENILQVSLVKEYPT